MISRKIAIPLALLLIVTPMAAASANKPPSDSVSADVDKTEIESDLQTNSAFLKSARGVVESSGNQDAMSYLKVAESALLEGIKHFNAGEYGLASEHIKESTRMAIQAIITAKNQQDLSIRDHAIRQEMALNEKHEIEHKIERINKGIPEVAVFIATAERLLSTDKNTKERDNVEEAKKLLSSAREDLAEEHYDASQDGLDRAYKLIIATVKELKNAKGETITYPTRNFKNDKEELDYELKKNNSYLFFATQSVSEDDKYAEEMIRNGEALKDEATEALKAGQNRKAIEKLRASTSMLLKAVRMSFKTK